MDKAQWVGDIPKMWSQTQQLTYCRPLNFGDTPTLGLSIELKILPYST
jgi:hypothetical protein